MRRNKYSLTLRLKRVRLLQQIRNFRAQLERVEPAKTHLTLAEVEVDVEGLWRFASGSLSAPECEAEAKRRLRLLAFENDF